MHPNNEFTSEVDGLTEAVSIPAKTSQYKAKQAWQSPEKASAYRVSRESKHYTRYHREERIVSEWLSDLPPQAWVLDVPCGSGRFIPLLTALGFQYVGADFSRAMILEA